VGAAAQFYSVHARLAARSLKCLVFLPGVLVYMAIYLRTRRLAPLIIAHWMMDLTAVFMTLSF
jgi:membrane protease YdiL (CAAX protease family)